jgi:hypothetical protein
VSEAHAFLAPSGADQWGPGGCPAAPTLQAQFPVDEDTPEAREGTAAHFYVTETISGRPCRIGDIAPNGHPIDKEMVDCGAGIIEDVRSTLSAAGSGATLLVECVAHGKGIIHAANWGTPDVTLIDFTNKRLRNWDYKYGHRYHDAFEHWQSIDYIILRLADLGVKFEEWHLWNCTVTIAQPRNYHPDGHLRYWHFTGDKLIGYHNALHAAAQLAMQPNAPMKTGDYCLDCTAVHACPAAQKLGMALVDYSLTGQPIELPPHALGLELRIIRAAIKRLEARAVGLEAQALSLTERGTDVPFWSTDYSYGRTRWNDDITVDMLNAYGEIYGLPMTKVVPGLTPNEAKKAGLPEDVTKSISHTPRGLKKLIPFDNKDALKRFA